MKTLWVIIIIAVLVVGGAILLLPSNNQPPALGSETGQTAPTNQNTDTGTSQNVTGPQTYTIDISNFAFNPKTLTINVGDTITWTNNDFVSHTVTSDSGSELDSESLSKGKTYSHTFTEAGTFDYHCAIHPSMTATIIVE